MSPLPQRAWWTGDGMQERRVEEKFRIVRQQRDQAYRDLDVALRERDEARAAEKRSDHGVELKEQP